MLLYHGSNQIVDKPRLIEQNRFLDFGYGFYTTANESQAEEFAKKVVLRRNGTSIVNIYELSESATANLKVLCFSAPDETWLDFVVANRSGEYNGEKYDLIIGPVANDDVYRTVNVYLAGLTTKKETLQRLKVKKLFNQYVFTSESALTCLTFVEAKEVKI